MKAFIFDLDGVIVFTDKLHYLSWKKLADKMDIRFDEKINNRLRGVSRAESLDIILEQYKGKLTASEKQELMEEKNRTYRTLLESMSPTDVSPEVRRTLCRIKEMGHKLAIGSSSKNASFILKKVELAEIFDAVSDGNNISNSKPDPEVFIKASDFLKVRRENCVVVEDAYAGIDAGKAANMLTVGIGNASNYNVCDYRITYLKDLLKIKSLFL